MAVVVVRATKKMMKNHDEQQQVRIINHPYVV